LKNLTIAKLLDNRDYCATVKPEHFIQEVEGFGRGGSMRSLLTHVANSSQHWIAVHTFRENPQRITADAAPTVNHCRELYKKIDELVYRLIYSFENSYHTEITSVTGDKTFMASPFKVFMHIITHEYHHKGQILTISRHLGYTPVDTDILR